MLLAVLTKLQGVLAMGCYFLILLRIADTSRFLPRRRADSWFFWC